MRAVVAEFVATALLLAIVVGSGVMGARLCEGNLAIALLANAIATGAGLVALILTFGPASGAHLNPAVSLAAALTGTLPWNRVPSYVAAQIVGAFAGVALAHAMFGLPLFDPSTTVRSGMPQALSEFVAALALVATVLGVARTRPAAVPFAVGAVITAGYWFTASTSFANPAATLARAATDTFAGVRPTDVPAFLAAQLLGALAAVGIFVAVLRPRETP